jgi:hypothetical protein
LYSTIVSPKKSKKEICMSQSSQPKFLPRYLEYVLAATKRNARTVKKTTTASASVCRLSTISNGTDESHR